MTINGPAPVMLGFFLNAAIDQRCEKHIREQGLEDTVENVLKANGTTADFTAPPTKAIFPKATTALACSCWDAQVTRCLTRRPTRR